MIYFTNDGTIDTKALSIFGLSVKPNENSIGMFGTGLKYAIAILLRHQCKIEIVTDDEVFKFTVRDSEYRGQGFQEILCNGVPLPFTTELGRNWDLWQAYRELYCNAVDEGGSVSKRRKKISPNQTVIAVDGLDEVHTDRDCYFVRRKPLHVSGNVEIHEGHDGSVFYQGIRVGKSSTYSLYRYNLTGYVDLTEDRTISSQWSVNWDISNAIMNLTNKKIITSYIDNLSEDVLEGTFGFSQDMSTEWLECMECRVQNLDIYQPLRRAYFNQCPGAEHTFRRPLKMESSYTSKALSTLSSMGYNVTQTIRYTDTLGTGVYARVLDGEIVLSALLFEKGLKTVILGILEEHVHISTGYGDMTRDLQTYLFEAIIGQYQLATSEVL